MYDQRLDGCRHLAESSHQNRQPCRAQAGRGCRELLGTIRPPEGASASSPRAMASTQAGRKGGRPPRGGGPRLGRELPASAHCAPALPFSSAEGPTPICACRVTSTPGRSPRAFSAPLAPRRPKLAPSRRPVGRRRPGFPRGTPRGPGPGSARRQAPRSSIRPPRNNGPRGCGRCGGRGGAGAPGRWKPRPSAGSLTTRARPRSLLPAPRRPAPGGAGARSLPTPLLLQLQLLLCKEGPGAGLGCPPSHVLPPL